MKLYSFQKEVMSEEKLHDIAEAVVRINSSKIRPVHRRNLDTNDIVEKTRLQLWTLKPALRLPRLFGIPEIQHVISLDFESDVFTTSPK